MDIGGIIGIVCAVASAAAAALALRRTVKKDTSDSGKAGGVILTEIGYIKSGVDDIKRHQEKQDDQYLDLRQRVTKVEASATQAHKRIDGIEETCREHHDCRSRKE
ncbi:MAG: hypothetical protein J6L81_06055 [Clostridia bacterium]|nr:hypothetical protein [Clostridia bacterium]